MTYHEELVNRLMTSGEWDLLTTEWRENFKKLDDQIAGALMVWQDEEHANCSVAKKGTPEGRQAAEELFLTSFRTLGEVFGGRLIHSDGGLTKLTNLGAALGNFLQEAENVGCSIPEFENQLVNLTTGSMTIVKALCSHPPKNSV